MSSVGLVDDTLTFFRSGYTYVSQRCDALAVDAFRTRLLGKPVVCARGEAAAASFYGADAFTRTGAMPKSAQHLLQDEGSVQDLDGARHRARKALFLPMLEPSSVASFIRTLNDAWQRRSAQWQPSERLVLSAELDRVLTEAALLWSGLTADRRTISDRCDELTAMIDNAGSVGPANWRARLLRRRAENWAARTIEGIRTGVAPASSGGMARAIAEHREDGQLLTPSIAAVELLNVLRPIVAVARFATFAAVALATFPGWRETFASGAESQLRPFMHEVRRYYPFFPVIGGLARTDVELAGYELPAGTWVLLDLYGTNHDHRLWPSPHQFRPERFGDVEPGPFGLVPQGGGDYATGHRCPGEHITIAALCELVRLLCREDYVLPAQDLTYTLRRMPTSPRSGVIMQRREA